MSASNSCRKDVKQLRRKAERAGWYVGRDGGGHLTFWPPNGARPLFRCPDTPGSQRIVIELRKNLRRNGVPI